MSAIAQDLRYGVRVLLRSPGFTAVVVLVLALGIGANSAIFSVINAVLLRPGPYRDPGQLCEFSDVNAQGESRGLRLADVNTFRERAGIIEQAAFWFPESVNASGPEGPENLYGVQVSADCFNLLGTPPQVGRLFRAEEFRPGAPGVVILSHRLWQRRFNGDRGVVGRHMLLNGRDHTVVGVMPQDFILPHVAFELWTAAQLSGGTGEERYIFIVRLRRGVTRQQAQVQLDAAIRVLAPDQGPRSHFRVALRPLGKQTAGMVSATLVVLLAAVGFVLLIACLNVANLLLARNAGRSREIAIRAAVGAGRLRLLRQLLTENLLLALLGSLAGLALAAFSSRVLVAIFPERIPVPRLEQTRVDASVLLFTLLLGVLTSLFFGLLPALRISRVNLNDALKEAGRGAAGSVRSQRLRNLLAVAETALSLVLLCGAGLMLRSFSRMLSVELGFQPDRLLTLRVPLPPAIQEAHREAPYVTRLIERVQTLPGLNVVGMTSVLPLGDTDSVVLFTVEGRPSPGGQPTVKIRCVNAGYFRAMGIGLLKGRIFNEGDGANAPPVAVISETLARQYFPNENPLGRRLRLEGKSVFTVVGVVNDVKYGSVTAHGSVEMYGDYRQTMSPGFSTTLVLRTSAADPMRMAAAVQKEIRAVNPDQPIRYLQSMRQVISESMAAPRFFTLLLGSFATIALLLAAAGLYGVLSYSVARRTHEIGIRVALGASRLAIARQVVGQAVGLAAIGIAIGLAGAFALTRSIAAILYEVTPTDPLTLASVSVLLMAVSAVASYIPARRAMAVDATVALRCE